MPVLAYQDEEEGQVNNTIARIVGVVVGLGIIAIVVGVAATVVSWLYALCQMALRAAAG